MPQAPAEGTKLMISAALAEGRGPKSATTVPPTDPVHPQRGSRKWGLGVAAAVVGTSLVVAATLYIRRGTTGSDPKGVDPGAQTSSSLWTTNFAQLQLVEQALVGRIHGWDFEGNRAQWRGTKLILQQRGGAGTRSLDVELDLPVKGGELVPGKSFEASHDQGAFPKPVRIQWEDDERQKHSRHFSSDYLVRLEITAVSETHVSGRIHLCLPDGEQSWVAGRFDAQIRTKQ